MRSAEIRYVALMTAVLLGGCASHTAATRPAAGAPPAAPVAAATNSAPAGATRDAWLRLFARGYFPGRSGQLFVVPREGDVITDRDPLYAFMHGSPWDYDTHIPLLLHGTGIKAGAYTAPAVQQDLAPTLASLIGLAAPATMTGRVLSEAVQSGSPPPSSTP